jgi:hypothetical protein
MPMLRYVLAASAALVLAGGVAAAQTQPAPPQNSPSAPADQVAPAPAAAPPLDDAGAQARSATEAGANASVRIDATGARVIVVSNPPVPDTPQNRAKYGGPLSNGGRNTPPAGN